MRGGQDHALPAPAISFLVKMRGILGEGVAAKGLTKQECRFAGAFPHFLPPPVVAVATQTAVLYPDSASEPSGQTT